MISSVPYCILNHYKTLYKLNEQKIVHYETNLGKLQNIMYDSEDSSITLLVQFLPETKTKTKTNTNTKTNTKTNTNTNTNTNECNNQQNQSTFFSEVQKVETELKLKYKTKYHETCTLHQLFYEVKIYIYLPHNSFSCSIFDEFYTFRNVNDLVRCYEQYDCCSVRMYLELFGVFYLPKQNCYELCIRCNEIQYFPIVCRKFVKNNLYNSNNDQEKQQEERIQQNKTELQTADEINELKEELKQFQTSNDLLMKQINDMKQEIKKLQSNQNTIQDIKTDSKRTHLNKNEHENQDDNCEMAKNHALYGKYLKMIEKRVPINAVRQKCMMEGITELQANDLMNIHPTCHYKTCPDFFVNSFYSVVSSENSLQFSSVSLKQMNNEELIKLKEKEESHKHENSYIITVEQIVTQMKQLRKTFFLF